MWLVTVPLELLACFIVGKASPRGTMLQKAVLGSIPTLAFRVTLSNPGIGQQSSNEEVIYLG